MKINGTIVAVLPVTTGESKKGGQWKSQDYVLETEGQYAKKVCFNLFGDLIEKSNVQMGSQVEIDFDIDSKEFNGRWFTNIKAWKVTVVGEVTAPAPAPVDSGMPF